MIILLLISCLTAKSQQPQHVHAQVEVVDSEIEITFIRQ